MSTQGPLFELDEVNATQYLAAFPLAPAGPWKVSSLGGGVSNTVLLVESPERRFVIKQSLGKLRVEVDWFADRTRIHRECEAISALASHLPAGSIPEVLFSDPDNCIYAMSAAPACAMDWKSQLLRGQVDTGVARKAALILASQIGASWRSARWQQRFGDQHCFEELRLDPYYRFTASRHPDLACYFEACIEACRRDRTALVHGDFSPKNLLVDGDSVIVIDFEAIHYGDPAFDAAFLLNHLMLKSAHRPLSSEDYARAAMSFWRDLLTPYPGDRARFEQSVLRHLGCLHLARVDGKSPAEYLTMDERDRVRQRALRLILDPPATVEDAFRGFS